MIKLLLLLIFCFYNLFGGVMLGTPDINITFVNSGNNTYLDGSQLIEGECYALIWTPTGETFRGFNDDGTCVSYRDRFMDVLPIWSNKSFASSFTVEYITIILTNCLIINEHDKNFNVNDRGKFELYLLDTRIKNEDGTIKLASIREGNPLLSGEGKPTAINAFVKLGEVSVPEPFMPSVWEPLMMLNMPTDDNSAIVSSLSVMTKPKITSIHVCDDVVELGIDNLSPVATTRLFCGDDYHNCSTYLSTVNTNLIKIKQKTNKQFFMLQSERNFLNGK